MRERERVRERHPEGFESHKGLRLGFEFSAKNIKMSTDEKERGGWIVFARPAIHENSV